ncbi:MAG: phage portal protein, partial [Candidatus Paceibacterota bacterium]
MATTPTDLQRAFDALKGKQSRYALLNDFYRGRQPLQYSTEKFRNDFSALTARWSENWAAVVVDALLDRISLGGFNLENEPASKSIATLWDSLDLSLDSDDIARDTAICSEAFLMVEKTTAKEDGTGGEVRVFANPPHLCHAQYCEDNPREMAWAAKWFDKDGGACLDIYYSDHIAHYVASKPRNDLQVYTAFTSSTEFEDGEEPNEYGRIPLFHFQRERGSRNGELTNVIPLQNALNKLFADMMVSAEFGAAPQRYAIIAAGTDSDDLANGPNKVWRIPFDAEAPNGKPAVGQFEATQLKNFLDAIDHIATKIAVITRTPKHYLLQQGDVSGEALIAMEAPLSRKANKYTERLGVTWRQAAQFILELSGHVVEVNDIEPIWEDVRTVQPLTESQIRLNNTNAGIPIEVQLEDEGQTEDEIARIHNVEQDRAERESDIGSIA